MDFENAIKKEKFMIRKQNLADYIQKAPLLKEVIALNPVEWLNPNKKKMAEMPVFPITKEDMSNAQLLWERFAPYLESAFPETHDSHGIIESPLKEIRNMQSFFPSVTGRLFLKCDNALPIAGSIKARGGIFEVLHYAEQLALHAGLIHKNDNYAAFNQKYLQSFFSGYTIGVGSTGNLGLSIGIISAKLGFKVNVYVSADAKKWKKDLLRSKGANVLEFEGDFSEAILAGRQATNENSNGYFVDDENSSQLFIGYSVAALRLKAQIEEKEIVVDAEHPLFVYCPCGVGGSPGGVSFGLKQIYGDNVHCFFVEPTHSPAVLVGLLTGEMSNICVQDLGIDNKTAADGLAVGRPSNFLPPL
ncbi:MAG TPA: D-serine ammonia-lyase [Edaphocola sp.]|nr:D-serine ammonia-lyase [Edaphocola sp.]